MAKFEIATTMIVRPTLTIEADSKEQAIQKLQDEEFDKAEFLESAFPISNIEAVEMWENGERIEDPAEWL